MKSTSIALCFLVSTVGTLLRSLDEESHEWWEFLSSALSSFFHFSLFNCPKRARNVSVPKTEKACMGDDAIIGLWGLEIITGLFFSPAQILDGYNKLDLPGGGHVEVSIEVRLFPCVIDRFYWLLIYPFKKFYDIKRNSVTEFLVSGILKSYICFLRKMEFWADSHDD